MFERYTEKARRAIFFARYEASQYGSPYIESEHILLGVLREAPRLTWQMLGSRCERSDVRAEVERRITRRERISTGVEVPLTQECKNILKFAAEEATALGHRYVWPEHVLLGILMATDSVGARILTERGAQLAVLRDIVKHRSGAASQGGDEAIAAVKTFLKAIRWTKWADLAPVFTVDAQFVDSAGGRWKGREEIGNHLESVLLPYAKEGVTSLLESVDFGASSTFIASVLWNNVTVERGTTRSIQRMTIIVVDERVDWKICFIQVTPVQVTE